MHIISTGALPGQSNDNVQQSFSPYFIACKQVIDMWGYHGAMMVAELQLNDLKEIMIDGQARQLFDPLRRCSWRCAHALVPFGNESGARVCRD